VNGLQDARQIPKSPKHQAELGIRSRNRQDKAHGSMILRKMVPETEIIF